ncbi:hypothetical protein O3M35_011328 [Rhynocoris fuscipes]
MPTESVIDTNSIVWKDWEAKGRSAFFQAFKDVVESSDYVHLKGKQKNSTLPKLLIKLFREGIHGSLKPEDVGEMCIVLSELHDEIPSLIMDTITVFDAELSSQDFVIKDVRQRLKQILLYLDDKWCPELARERLEFETLAEFNMIVKTFHTKFIKIKTKLYYKQNKFNLFREENEGYSKLIMQLHKIDSKPETIVSNIRSLNGCFSIDPTRVIDIILDVFQSMPKEVKFFIPVIKLYMPEINLLTEVIGFRYATHQEDGITPKSLHEIVCILLHNEVFTVDNIYPWLTPHDDDIAKEIEETAIEEKSVKKPAVSQKEEVKKDKSKFEYEKNQKLGLCEVAASLGSWKTFRMMLSRLPESYVIEKPQIAMAICQFIHYLIHKVYVKYSGFSEKMEISPPDFQPSPITEDQPNTFLEVTERVFPMLHTLGAALRYDLVLVFKITRITSSVLSQIMNAPANPESEAILERITNMVGTCLLPTLSNIEANCCVSEAIWNVIKLYPLQTRYSMYYNWRIYLKTNEAVLSKRFQGKVNAKACMKRVSKENVKQIGRLLGKLSHYSPVTLFDIILYQIQMYDNLIGPVVDALKYMTNLSYDVLGFCIFDSLCNDTRQKHDGNGVLPWFQSTSLFCATVFKKYNVDLSGILLYIMEQLRNNRSVDLLLLKEILQKMTGIDITDVMTDHQIEALGGGELLKAEAGFYGQQRNFKKTATRLKQALVDNNLTAPLGIMLAQQKSHIIFSESQNSHLKFVGKLYDECHETLLQYGSFVSGSVMHDSYATFPSIHELLLEYRLEFDTAFFLSRALIHSIANDQKLELEKKSNLKKGSVNMTDVLFDIMETISESIQELYPSRHWDDISPQFVAIFWTLALNDISVPLSTYQKEIAKQEQDQSNSSKQNRDDKSNSIVDKLNLELVEQQAHVKNILENLKKYKDNWFLLRSVKPAKNEMITQFLQLCIFPRCIFSITDALYCAQFIHTLHSIRTANFSTLLLYDRIFCDITFGVMSCTENEASRYGRFLCAVLENIMRWHSSKEIYDKECANTPGFVTKFRVSNEFSEPNDNVHFENFRHVCHKWHYKITRSLINLLESGEFIQIRNAILFLIKLLPVFPVISKLAQFIEKRINKVREEEKNNRQDLYTLATSYSGLLMSKSSKWISESDFHVVSASSTPADTTSSLKEDIDSESFSSQTDIYFSNSDPASPESSIKDSEKSHHTTKDKKSSRHKESERNHSPDSQQRDEDKTKAKTPPKSPENGK